MWSEELDKKAQEAAGSHHPAFDDKSWDKMEAMLNKHLPEEKKRRRFAIWFILPIMAGILAFFIIRNNNNTADSEKITTDQQQPATTPANNEIAKSTTVIEQKENSATTTDQHTTENKINSTNPGKADLPTVTVKTSVVTANDMPIPAKQNPVRAQSNNTNGLSTINNRPAPKQTAQLIAVGKPARAKNQSTRLINTKSTGDNDVAVTNSNKSTGSAGKNEIVTNDKPVNDDQQRQKLTAPISNANPADDTKQSAAAVTEPKDNAVAKAEPAAPAEQQPAKTAPNKIKKPGQKGFSLLVSAGPDLSGLGMAHSGTVKMQYGLGLSYAFNKNISLRTGFYAGRKVYSANPSEYHPEYNFWMYYPYLKKIDANCLVYEIPVTAVYNFASSKKHSWFVSTGLSSFLMKKETYDYYSKNPNGQVDVRTRTISNENKHLFSVLNLSGGYQYRVSNRLSIMAEPYFKLPVSGVGFGKVKLNSAGVLLTAAVNLK